MVRRGMDRVRFHSNASLRVRFRVRLQVLRQAEAMGVSLRGLKLDELARSLTRPGSADARRFEDSK